MGQGEGRRAGTAASGACGLRVHSRAARSNVLHWALLRIPATCPADPSPHMKSAAHSPRTLCVWDLCQLGGPPTPPTYPSHLPLTPAPHHAHATDSSLTHLADGGWDLCIAQDLCQLGGPKV